MASELGNQRPYTPLNAVVRNGVAVRYGLTRPYLCVGGQVALPVSTPRATLRKDARVIFIRILGYKSNLVSREKGRVDIRSLGSQNSGGILRGYDLLSY